MNKNEKKVVTSKSNQTESIRKATKRQNALDYLANPENPWPSRADLSHAMGYSQPCGLYKVWSLEEIAELEAAGLSLRRERCAHVMGHVDANLLRRATSPDADAATIKLAYQRIEGWREGLDVGAGGTMADEIIKIWEKVQDCKGSE